MFLLSTPTFYFKNEFTIGQILDMTNFHYIIHIASLFFIAYFALKQNNIPGITKDSSFGVENTYEEQNSGIEINSSDLNFPVWPLPETISAIGPNSTYFIQNYKDFVIKANVVHPIMQEAIERYQKFIFSSSTPTHVPCQHCVKGLTIQIQDTNAPVLDSDMNEEYILNLDIRREVFELRSQSVWGALRGLETFSQLVELEANKYVMKNINIFIRDRPRFPWRGFMIDTSRHYLDVNTILKTVEVMSYHKLNVLHWHIVDDESFPFEVKEFPRLTGAGAYSKQAIYTREDMKKVVEFALKRGIRVIPEFDMPAHTRSWGLGYDITVSCPEYIRRSPFRNNIGMNPGKPLLYEVIEGVIKEALNNFPEKYYHFGADEVRKDCWAEDQNLRDFMRRMNFGDNYDKVLAYFEQKLEVIYRKYGKTMIAWQELLLEQREYNVPKDVIVHTWKKQEDLVRSVRRGYKSLLSAGWYMDYQIPTGGQRRHLWVQNWMDYYLNEPFRGQNYNETEKKLILGGWGCAWGEVIDNMVYEERIWPRASAIAERLWSPQHVNSTRHALKRLGNFRCNTLVRRGVKATPIEPSYCRYNYNFDS